MGEGLAAVRRADRAAPPAERAGDRGGVQPALGNRANPLGANHAVILCTWQAGAVLRIGEGFAMTGGSLCAAESVTIGDGVLVGANCTIIDSDFHPSDAAERRADPKAGKTAPVVIEDGVFIGMNSLVLKGVHLGKGSTVAAGSVVTHDVPAGALAGGNPAG